MNVNLNNIGAGTGAIGAGREFAAANVNLAQAKGAEGELKFSGARNFDILMESEPISEIPAGALSRDDAIGRLVSAAFSLPPPPMPAFNV